MMNRFRHILFSEDFLYHWLPAILVFLVVHLIDWYKTNNWFINIVLWVIISGAVSYGVITFVNSERFRLFVATYIQEDRKKQYFSIAKNIIRNVAYEIRSRLKR